MLGNNFGKTSKTFPTSKNVWHGKSKVYPVGGTVKNLSAYSAGDIIPAASMAIFDSVNSEVTIVNVPVFDATKAYAIGDATVYEGVVYIANSAVTAGERDADEWTALDAIDAYSSSATYDTGDLVKYDGKVYKCKSTISAAEAWTAAHWTETPKATAAQDVAKVNGLTQHDVYLDAAALDATYGGATVSVVYEGVLFVSRIANEIPEEVFKNNVAIKAYKEA